MLSSYVKTTNEKFRSTEKMNVKNNKTLKMVKLFFCFL